MPQRARRAPLPTVLPLSEGRPGWARAGGASGGPGAVAEAKDETLMMAMLKR